MEAKKLVYENTPIQYAIAGTGNPVMLLHGFGEDSRVWKGQVTHLKTNYKLIVPDLPGSGQSAFLNKKNASLEDYAEILKAILKNEQIEKCTLIGHSMGGYITLAFAEKYGDMLSAFGLFHSSAFADDEEKKASRKKAIEFVHQNGAHAFLKTSIPGLFYNQSNSKADIDELLDRAKQFSDEAVIQYYEAMIARPDRTAVLKSAQVPVLFILGTQDKAVPFEAGLKQVHMPVLSEVEILRNSAHMGMLEESCLANAALENFLAKHSH